MLLDRKSLAVTATLTFAASGALAHECTTTYPLGSIQPMGFALFQTVVADWQDVRDRIVESDSIRALTWLEVADQTIQTEMVSLTRSAQIEQRVVDVQGNAWNVIWQLADHHGDCTEVRVEMSWQHQGVTPTPDFGWWRPVQEHLLQNNP